MDKAIVSYIMENLGLDDMDVIKELYDEYTATIRQKLADAEAALKTKDFPMLARHAHAMKGCALNIGHESLATIAKELEYLGKGIGPETPTTENCSKLLQKLHDTFQAFQEA